MKNFLDDPDDLQDEKMTREDKLQLLIKVVPILLIIVILLITLLVNQAKKQQTAEEEEDVVSTEILLPSPDNGSKESAADGKADDKTSVPSAEVNTSPANMASPSPSALPEETLDFSKVEFDTQTQLKEMMTYWKAGNQEALDDLANLERFRAMSYQLKGTTAFYYAGDVNTQGEPHGTGIAVYADNQYYYGEWKNGLRDGNGKWMHYHIHASASYPDVILYHQYTGSFKEDLPDGEGAEHYDFNTELFEGNDRYYTNLIGSYSKGLYNGVFYFITSSNSDEYEEWEGTAKNGSFVYCKDQKDQNGRKPVATDLADEDNYIWMSDKENQNLGIRCYISKR